VQATHEAAGGEGGAEAAGTPVQLAVVRVDLAVTGADRTVTSGAAPRAPADTLGPVRGQLALAARPAVLARTRICNTQRRSRAMIELRSRASLATIHPLHYCPRSPFAIL
jgi:hypothetical protein